jgi:hypothetical protein
MEEYMTVPARDLRTVSNDESVPILEIIKENGNLTIYEADDMDRQIRIPVSFIPKLVKCLEELR